MALEDLQKSFHFISAESPRHGHEWLEYVFRQVERLIRFPNIGRQISELGRKSRYRQVVAGEYRIFHEVRDKEIFIFRVLHCRQMFED